MLPDPLPPELTVASKTVFRGVRFDVRSVQLPGRSTATVQRDVVVTPDSAVILPLLDERTVVMIRGDRFAVGQTLWELPAGTVEAGEQAHTCAARELIEETGYRAQTLAPMIDFYPTPGICTEFMHAFLATDLTHVGQDLDENERITVQTVSLDEALRMIQNHTIRDAKTIAVLLYHRTFTQATQD